MMGFDCCHCQRNIDITGIVSIVSSDTFLGKDQKNLGGLTECQLSTSDNKTCFDDHKA